MCTDRRTDRRETNSLFSLFWESAKRSHTSRGSGLQDYHNWYSGSCQYQRFGTNCWSHLFAPSTYRPNLRQFFFRLSHLKVALRQFFFIHSHLKVALRQFFFRHSHLKVALRQFFFRHSHLKVALPRCPETPGVHQPATLRCIQNLSFVVTQGAIVFHFYT